jgi:predicted transposase YbfD/YdcC
MQSTVLAAVREVLEALPRAAEHLGDLPALFAAVPDPRARRGRRYDLPFLLTCLVAGLLCNCNSLDAIGEWCRHHRALLRRYCGPRRHLTPTGSLYRRLLPRLSVAPVEAALACWVRESLAAEADDALAWDGKTLRGAALAGAAAPAPHLLSVSTHRSQETLLQVRVDEKTNEIPVARALLPALPLAGRVVTADALHTQVETAQAILDQQGDYLLVVKRNQETLYAECAAYFSDPRARVGRATTLDRRRGRSETRTLYATTGLNAHLTRYSRFPRIGQVACLLTTVVDRRGTQREVRFLLTSLPPERADPARLLALVRGHWRIESRHWTRDATFGEDRSRLRSGDGPQIMAALRNLVITLIRRLGTTRIAAQRRAFAARPAHALRLLGLRPR